MKPELLALKRLREAVDFLDQIASLAPANRGTHIQVQVAVKLLNEYLASATEQGTVHESTKPESR